MRSINDYDTDVDFVDQLNRFVTNSALRGDLLKAGQDMIGDDDRDQECEHLARSIIQKAYNGDTIVIEPHEPKTPRVRVLMLTNKSYAADNPDDITKIPAQTVEQ